MWSGSMRTILIFPLSQRTRGLYLTPRRAVHPLIRLRRSAAAKRAFRWSLIEALRQRTPALSDEAAGHRARVMLQIVRSMKQLYPEAVPANKAIVVKEFKTALTAYVKTVFSAGSEGAHEKIPSVWTGPAQRF